MIKAVLGLLCIQPGCKRTEHSGTFLSKHASDCTVTVLYSAQHGFSSLARKCYSFWPHKYGERDGNRIADTPEEPLINHVGVQGGGAREAF